MVVHVYMYVNEQQWDHEECGKIYTCWLLLYALKNFENKPVKIYIQNPLVFHLFTEEACHPRGNKFLRLIQMVKKYPDPAFYCHLLYDLISLKKTNRLTVIRNKCLRFFPNMGASYSSVAFLCLGLQEVVYQQPVFVRLSDLLIQPWFLVMIPLRFTAYDVMILA